MTFCKAVHTSYILYSSEWEKKKWEGAEKRNLNGRREYQRFSGGNIWMIFFFCFSWQQQFCITKEPIYPLSNMIFCASHTRMIHMHSYFKNTHRRSEDTQAQKNHLYLNAQAHTHIHSHTSNRYSEPESNMLLFENLINSRCMSVWDSRCMWLLVCVCALANNHLNEPDQRLSLRLRAAVLAGERHTITQRPQTSRLHNLSTKNINKKKEMKNTLDSELLSQMKSCTCVDARIQRNF